MESFKEYFTKLREYLRTLTSAQMTLLGGVGAALLAGMIVLAIWVNSVQYSVLYADLDPADAGEVVNYLSENSIKYKLEHGGTTVMVPSDEVYKLRITLASQGIPESGHIGYALFDQSNLGMTEFLQNLNFRRALEGELMNTIMQLKDVEAARVHIVMPKERLFKEDKKEATASIVLKLKRAGGLSKSQLDGITHLVASSVEGLKPENISIIDYNGNLLSSRVEHDPLAGLTATQLEVRKSVEQYLEDKTQSLLDEVVGTGKAIVRVSADLNFQQVERTSELYDPNSPVIRSEEKTTETASVSDRQDEAAESKDEKATETSITNYEINKTVEHIINSIGGVSRLTVAVMLDGVYKEDKNAEGVVEKVYVPRSQEELDRIAAIVRTAVGYDAQRNDVIEVVNLGFDRTAIDMEQDKLDQMIQQEFYVDLGKKIGLGLLILLGLLYARWKVKKMFRKVFPPAEAPVSAAAVDGEATAAQESDSETPLEPVVKKVRRPRLVDQMQKEAFNRPEEIARVIKTMMSMDNK